MQRTKNKNLQQRRLDITPRDVGMMCDFYTRSAEDNTITDIEGNQYIDFTAGIAVLNTGYRHPRLVQAVEAQLQAFIHTTYQIVSYESHMSLTERINVVASIDGKRKTTFFTTGTETVESAVKIARAHTDHPDIIAFGGDFRRRTYMTMTLTGKVAPYKKGFGPFPDFAYHAPYPSELQGISTADSLKAIERLFETDIDLTQVTAIIFKPVQGEGGFVVAPPESVATIRHICDEHGIVIIADEVQSEFARTGQLFAMGRYADKADLTTMAKNLAGGIPLSGVVGKTEIMSAPTPGSLGGTYAGSPLSIAAAHAVLNIIRDEQLCQRAAALGGQLRAALTDAQAGYPEPAEVRGLGSIIAAEFCDAATGEPNVATAQRVQKKALEQGLLLLICGQYGNVIRFLYSLTVPQGQFAKALDIIKAATR